MQGLLLYEYASIIAAEKSKSLKMFTAINKVPKKFLFLGACLLLVVVYFIFFRPKPATIELTTVKKENLQQIVSASGVITGNNVADLTFQSGGLLSFVNVKVGDQVTQGEVIAELDSRQLALNLQQAENTLKDDQAAVDKVLDDIHLYQYGNGGFSNIGSANETQTQRADRISAQTTRDSASNAVQADQIALGNTVLTSPINGIITAQAPLAGQTVTATDTIAEVTDFSQIVFAADVDESDISKVSLGDQAEVTIDAYGDKIFKGTVTEINPTTKTASNGGTVVTVKIALNDQSIKKISGLNGSANIITESKNNVLAIPQDALGDNSAVILKTANGFEKKIVNTGFQSDTDIEVTSGLKEGEQIVLNPNDNQQILNKTKNPFLRLLGR